MQLWLTRDKELGELSPIVEAWTIPPDRHIFPDGDVMWVAPMGQQVDRRLSLHSTWERERALWKFGSVPEQADEPITVLMSVSQVPTA